MARLNRLRRTKFPDIVSAGGGSVKALLDAVAFVLNKGECEIDFGDDTGDVEALGIWELLEIRLIGVG
jgi:hypothetical protein